MLGTKIQEYVKLLFCPVMSHLISRDSLYLKAGNDCINFFLKKGKIRSKFCSMQCFLYSCGREQQNVPNKWKKWGKKKGSIDLSKRSHTKGFVKQAKELGLLTWKMLVLPALPQWWFESPLTSFELRCKIIAPNSSLNTITGTTASLLLLKFLNHL